MRVDVREVERKVRAQVRAGCAQGLGLREDQRAGLEGTHAGGRDAAWARPAGNLDRNLDSDMDGAVDLDGIAYLCDAAVASELVESVVDGRHRAPCGIGVRADDTTAAALAPASFFDGGCTPCAVTVKTSGSTASAFGYSPVQ